MVETTRRKQLLMAHKNTLNSKLPVNWQKHSLGTYFRHILGIRYVNLYRLLKDAKFYSQVLS